MSRTDMHRPVHALAHDPSMRKHFKEFHEHTKKDGQGRLICDIEIAWDALLGGRWRRTSCYVLPWTHLRICGCALCTGARARRRIRRRDRQNTRRACHDLVAQQAGGDLDEDGPQTPWAGGIWD